MKICLATVHANSTFTPLALLYLKAYAVEQGGRAFDDVEIIEFTRADLPDEIVARVLASDPAVIGFSCYVWNIRTLMAACRRIKELRPGATIVLGGPEVGPVAAPVLDANPAVDVIVSSEGEIPFVEILDTIERDGDLAQVKGIVFRRDGAIVDTGEAPLLQDLNHLSSPHTLRFGDHKGRAICVETQRGCVFRCNFCFYNKDLSVRNRRFDLDRVKQEILFWLQQDVSEIYFMDPVFNLNAARTKEICRFIAEHNVRHIDIHAEVWAEFIDEDMARLFHDAHFEYLEVGLQTTDDTALATVERRLKLRQFTDGIGYLKQYDLKFELQLICGLPGETLASFRRSLNFACSLDPPYLDVFPLMILPGTELWKKARSMNLDFDPEPPYHVRSHLSMSQADIAYGQGMIDALDVFWTSRTIRTLARETGVTFADVIDGWIDWQRREPASAVPPVTPFILDFCAQRGIPTAFYRASALREFSDEAAHVPATLEPVSDPA